MKYLLSIILILLTFSCGDSDPQKIVTKEPVQKEAVIKYKEKITNPLGMNFVYIRPGTFEMGKINEPLLSNSELITRSHMVTLTKGF
jgi:hypothetical protein